MRTILIAMLAAAGIGLLGTTGASAMPLKGLSTEDTAVLTDQVTKVSHWRWGSRHHHWRYGSRHHHWRWGSRHHHWRYGSRHRHWRWGSRY
jgi:hypothetical protein